ncbi:DAK2 domain-containing protein [Streptomyces sp. YIM 98790]|uniref:DAK2 domain-containing protein n=1 Tax=Streptomyces sp. YIM 98790 TaxID=2689077 RepID=UPI00140B6D65|nr:DAK2 domain-containing protein [Streptomyces sp. YIM 98790]
MRWFTQGALAVEEELTELDQLAGDGDFGANLGAGARAARRRLDRLPWPASGAAGSGAALPLEATATAFLDEIGGTSGPMFGLLLQSLAAAVDDAGTTTGALRDGTVRGLAAIRRVGGAAPGDKTLVDALAPAAGALAAAPPETPPERALSAAAEAAWQGVRDTARLRARLGRASYLGDRTAGVPDPGAAGIGLLFGSAAGPVGSLRPHLGKAG